MSLQAEALCRWRCTLWSSDLWHGVVC